MAKSKPYILSVIRRGKTYTYELASEMDWAVIFDTVLEVKSVNPAGKFYWPLDAMTLWKVEPQTAPSGHA